MKPPRRANLAGRTFGRLSAISSVGVTKGGAALWECRCVCGKTARVAAASLVHGRTISCGCFNRERVRETHRKHGAHGTAVYAVWQAMIGRCTNPRHRNYRHYGGRGITVCSRWRESFEAFRDDMGPRPSKGTLERIRNNEGYRPGNCQWASMRAQSVNTRRNVRISIDGIERVAIDWARINGLKRGTVFTRLQRGWDPVRAVTTPAGRAA